MGLNTLYIGDTPILGTEQDTVVIKTDIDQSLNIQTFGIGTTNMTSQKGINVNTNGMNADVVVQADGAGSKVRFGATSAIDFTAPVSNVDGNLTLTGDLTVTGNATFNGSPVVVNAEVVQVKDNIIVVNHGETGNGVTSGTAGLRVDRGELVDFLMVYDESVDRFRVGKLGDLQTIATQDWVSANTTMSWNDLEDKPSTFTPSAHTHNYAGSSTAGGAANSVASILTRGTGLTGNNFNGSAATTWAVSYGTAAGTACQGNDSRLDPDRTRKTTTSTSNPSGGTGGDVWMIF